MELLKLFFQDESLKTWKERDLLKATWWILLTTIRANFEFMCLCSSELNFFSVSKKTLPLSKRETYEFNLKVLYENLW